MRIVWILLLLPWLPVLTAADETTVPSQLASGGFQDDGGFSFRTRFESDHVQLARTSYQLPRPGNVMPAFLGEAIPIQRMGFGANAQLTEVHRDAWDHQVAHYQLNDGNARVYLSRLSPAVLVDTSGREFRLGYPAPAYLAVCEHGQIRSGKVDDFVAREIDSPWICLWFGTQSPYRAYTEVMDVNHEHDGAGFARGDHSLPSLDFPLLVRLERPVQRLELLEDQLRFHFREAAGKIAIMPLFGGAIVRMSETAVWATKLPQPVAAACQQWSRDLRDYPLTVRETFEVDAADDILRIHQAFRWLSFRDTWGSPGVKAAPLPPLPALALNGNPPVRFVADQQAVEPECLDLMDTPGMACVIRGVDQYTCEITGLGELLFPAATGREVPESAQRLREKLEQHVTEMVDAGHLAPLFFMHGGISPPSAAYFYWGSPPDTARALAAAFPYLSSTLQERVQQYLRDEFAGSPPLTIDLSAYRTGTNRAPYDVPWDRIGRGINAAYQREMRIRQSRRFGDLYGIDAYERCTEQRIDDRHLREHAERLSRDLLQRQDWALGGPIMKPPAGSTFFRVGFYDRNGPSTYNSWIAGSIGLTRLARRHDWPDLEQLGWYLFGKLTLARIGMARYVVEQHRMGLVEGPAEADWRALVHIDTTAAILARGPIVAVVREDQEIPPFIDLTHELGQLLARHARQSCEIYLRHLDRSMPLWYLSEAPKQSGSEQRLCPLWHKSGNVLAQYWVLGKRGEQFTRYVDTTRFRGDLFYVENLAAAIDSCTAATGSLPRREKRTRESASGPTTDQN